MCCGKARANLSYSHASAQSTAGQGSRQTAGAPLPGPAVTGNTPLQLRYVGQQGIVVRGPATGKPYTFTAGQQIQTVDPRDAAVLLRTHYFRRD